MSSVTTDGEKTLKKVSQRVAAFINSLSVGHLPCITGICMSSNNRRLLRALFKMEPFKNCKSKLQSVKAFLSDVEVELQFEALGGKRLESSINGSKAISRAWEWLVENIEALGKTIATVRLDSRWET